MGGCFSSDAETEETRRLVKPRPAPPGTMAEKQKIASTATFISNNSLTWEVTVPDVRNLSHTPEYSSPLTMNDLRWRIKIWVQKSWSSMLLPKWTMAWFIVCDAAESITPEDPGWRCDVASDLRLLPWSDKCPELSRSLVHTFHSGNPECGVEDFVAFEDIMDLENGYVDPSNFSLRLVAVITAKMSRKRSSASVSSIPSLNSGDLKVTTPSPPHDNLNPDVPLRLAVEIDQLTKENVELKEQIEALKRSLEEAETNAKATEYRLETAIAKAEGRAKMAEERSERFICKVCYEQDSSLLFYPCKHIACCDECNALLRSKGEEFLCPVCRVIVKSAVSVFHS